MGKHFIFLILLCGLSYSGPGQPYWMQYIPEKASISHPAPVPQLTNFPPLPNNSQDLDTLFYDDRTAYTAWAWYQRNQGWGLKFIPPADNVTLAGALLHLWDTSWPVPGGNRYLIRVYDDDGPGGTPGSRLFASDTLIGQRGVWNYAPINIPVTGPFYIFYVQADSFPLCPGFSIDRFDNAPAGVEWQLVGGGFQEDTRAGEWLLRAVINWAPQNENLSTTIFGNLPLDTAPRISLTIRASLKNFGLNSVPPGVRVKMRISGPLGYLYEDLDETTQVSIPRRASRIMTFSPAWRIPDTSGSYNITVWHEYGPDQFRKNDTIHRRLSVAHWLTYANWNNPVYLLWRAPQRATRFTPNDFGLSYPFSIQRLKAQFYWDSRYPWPDSTFRFRIYGNNGQTILYESDIIKAVSYPRVIEHDVRTPPVITSGDFWVALLPQHSSGHPSSLADDTSRSKSYYGTPGSWNLERYGEYFIAAAVGGVTAIEEASSPRPVLNIKTYPNPGTVIKVIWQVKSKTPCTINLYDATGRMIKNLYQGIGDKTKTSGVFEITRGLLPSGVYIVQLKTPQETINKKVVLHYCP